VLLASLALTLANLALIAAAALTAQLRDDSAIPPTA
jgi:hypothetical protein